MLLILGDVYKPRPWLATIYFPSSLSDVKLAFSWHVGYLPCKGRVLSALIPAHYVSIVDGVKANYSNETSAMGAAISAASLSNETSAMRAAISAASLSSCSCDTDGRPCWPVVT
jgi:hypothetical protein